VAFVVVFCYFLVDSRFYLISIGGYIAYSLVKKKRIYNSALAKAQKRYLQQNSTVDNYIEKNRFWGNEDDFVDSLDIFLLEEEVAASREIEATDNTTQTPNIDNKNSLGTVIMKFINSIIENNEKEIYFVLANVLTFVTVDTGNITFVGTILLSFFTFQIIFLLKIIVNTHYLNVRSINNIKKQLNYIDLERD
jgi:hypothetical protein